MKNNSAFKVRIDHLDVQPDGFPEVDWGWRLGESGIFRDKELQSEQRIRIALSPKQIRRVRACGGSDRAYRYPPTRAREATLCTTGTSVAFGAYCLHKQYIYVNVFARGMNA